MGGGTQTKSSIRILDWGTRSDMLTLCFPAKMCCAYLVAQADICATRQQLAAACVVSRTGCHHKCCITVKQDKRTKPWPLTSIKSKRVHDSRRNAGSTKQLMHARGCVRLLCLCLPVFPLSISGSSMLEFL